MKTVDTLTEAIHLKADAEFESRLKLALEPIWNQLRSEFGTDFDRVPELRIPSMGLTLNNVWPPGLLFGAIEAFKISMRDKVRAKAVEDFMRKVENLGSEIDELRNTINQ